MTTYIYTRVSTTEQTAGTSLADQERVCRGAAMVRGADDLTVAADAGVSGSIPLYERPDGGDMMRKLVTGDAVIAAKMDRMFRSAVDALQTVDELKHRGVSLILVDMGMEPVTENGVGRLFFSIMAAMAEFERTRILERMTDGRKGKAARGGHIGGQAPYGQRVVGHGKDARLEPNADEQAVIDMARMMRLDGMSLRNIAVELPLSRAGVPFKAQQVARMVAALGQ
jgi:DNA invertase Pin-like site-specific DNA recombinase